MVSKTDETADEIRSWLAANIDPALITVVKRGHVYFVTTPDHEEPGVAGLPPEVADAKRAESERATANRDAVITAQMPLCSAQLGVDVRWDK